jgi:short-subunit dehydrogenase
MRLSLIPQIQAADERGRKTMQRWRGKWALVTGASSGIGWALAEQLAANGTNLVLTARRRERLEKFVATIAAKASIRTEIFISDLSKPHAPAELFGFTGSKNIEIDFLINNAGFGEYGSFYSTNLNRQMDMVRVNCAAVVELTHHYLAPMVQRRRGDILILASTAAFQAVPYISVYAATKAFDLLFAQGLAEEVREFGVSVCALCPGSTTDTEFKDVSNSPSSTLKHTETAAKVARVGLEALTARKNWVVSGLLNRLGVEAQRLIPRSFVTQVAKKMYQPEKQPR